MLKDQSPTVIARSVRVGRRSRFTGSVNEFTGTAEHPPGGDGVAPSAKFGFPHRRVNPAAAALLALVRAVRDRRVPVVGVPVEELTDRHLVLGRRVDVDPVLRIGDQPFGMPALNSR